jgi:glycine cleavage system H lipoate-binding protein
VQALGEPTTLICRRISATISVAKCSQYIYLKLYNTKKMATFHTPKDLWYNKDGFWFRINGGVAEVGISDWMQDEWGMFAGVDILDFETRRGAPYFTLQDTNNRTVQYNIEVPGEVEINPEYQGDIYTVNNCPYEFVMHTIKMHHPEDRTGLMTADQFAKSKGYTPYYEL